MYPYWLLFLIFALGAITTEASRPAWPVPNRAPAVPAGGSPVHGREGPLMVAAILTAAMIGFRFRVGADWDSYQFIYGDIQRLGVTKALLRWEPGYTLINFFAGELGAGIWLVNLICGLIFMYGVVQFARRQPNPWLAVLVGVPYLIIGVGMGYTRQAVAIGCCMAGFAALSRGSFRRMVLWVIAGAMFHRTALVVLPLVTLSYARNRFQTLLVLIVGSYIAYKLLWTNIDKFQNLYIHRAYEAQGSGVRLAMNITPAVIFLSVSRRFGLSEDERRIWRNFAIVAVLSLLLWLGTRNTVVVDRLALYLIPLQIIVFSRLPNVLSNSDSPSGEYKGLIILYCAVVQFTWLNFANHAGYWVPYTLYPFN
jgi:hypothetical protein